MTTNTWASTRMAPSTGKVSLHTLGTIGVTACIPWAFLLLGLMVAQPMLSFFAGVVAVAVVSLAYALLGGARRPSDTSAPGSWQGGFDA